MFTAVLVIDINGFAQCGAWIIACAVSFVQLSSYRGTLLIYASPVYTFYIRRTEYIYNNVVRTGP